MAISLDVQTWVSDADLEANKKRHALKKHSLLATIALAYGATGVIYGDIGTSPLYVYSSTFSSGPPTEHQILGAACLIFYTITIAVILKYCLIVLYCDDNGEGGTFALYSLICRFTNIRPANAGAPDSTDMALSKYSGSFVASHHAAMEAAVEKSKEKLSPISGKRVGAALRRLLEKNSVAQLMLLGLVLIMTSLVLGDGILTPAQSVLGAIYGVQYKATVSQGAIVGISCGILIALFLVQPFGTGKISFTFAPIVLTWFLFNVIVAIYNIVNFYPAIFKCLNPYWGYKFFAEGRHTAWQQLAGIFLCITGTEATFADLGHFSRRAIQIAFVFIAYPVLSLTYIGQAAWLIKNPDLVGSTFFASIPTAWGNGFYWLFFVIATAAACVASQAMISAAFTIISQSVALGCFPRVTIIHTSKTVTGQVYIPEVNYVLMVLVVVVVAVFKTTTLLGNAYGVAVSLMMLGTTFLTFVAMLVVWELNLLLALAFLIFFSFFDGVYVSANLEKIPHGGYYAIAIAGVAIFISGVYTWGNMKKRNYIVNNKVDWGTLLSVGPPSNGTASGQLLNGKTKEPLARPPGVALVYSETLFGAPPLMPVLVDHWHALQRVLIMVHVRQVAVPSVDLSERILLAPISGYPGVFRAVVRYGYTDPVKHDQDFVASILAKVVAEDPQCLVRGGSNLLNESAVHILSRPIISVVPGTNPVTRFMLLNVYDTISRFSRRGWENWEIPHSKLFEVGMVYDLK